MAEKRIEPKHFEPSRPTEPIVPVNGTYNAKEAWLITAMAIGCETPYPEYPMSRAEYLAAFDNEKYMKAVNNYRSQKMKMLGGVAIGICESALCGEVVGINAATEKFVEYILSMNGLGKKTLLDSGKRGKNTEKSELDDLVTT